MLVSSSGLNLSNHVACLSNCVTGWSKFPLNLICYMHAFFLYHLPSDRKDQNSGFGSNCSFVQLQRTHDL